MGVRMAMNTILKNAHEDAGPLQTLGPLIHNPQTLDLLKQKKVTTVKSPKEITAGTVVIRTHGVPPDVEQEVRSLAPAILDATCPHVKRIHRIIDEYYQKGYAILIYGDEGHAEVIGLQGYARDRGYLIQNPAQIDALPPLSKVCLVAQTTQSLSEYQEIKARVSSLFPGAAIFDTICRATDNRQKEVEQLAHETDVLVVVGGKNSANSTRLFEIGKQGGHKAFHIETEDELSPRDFVGVKTVAVVSGASTPSWLIHRVTERLKEIGRSQRPWYIRLPHIGAEWFVAFNGYLALGAMLMTWVALYLQSEPIRLLHLLVAGLYINSMYILNHLTHIRANQYEEIFKTDHILRHRKTAMSIFLLTGLFSIILAGLLSRTELIFITASCIAGVLYHINLFPKNNLPFLKHRKLKDITLSKDLGIAFAWSFVCVLAPYARPDYLHSTFSIDTVLTFLYFFVLSFIRTIFHDLHDIQRDMIVGRETIPIVMGKKLKLIFPNLLLILMGLIPLVGVFIRALPANSLLLVTCPIYLYIVHYLFKNNKLADTTLFDTVVDFVFILPFILLFISRTAS